MIVRIFWAALAVLTLSTTLALADAQRLAAQKCALSTRAPGNYNVSNAPGLPHVLPGQGGTTDGAARINDCLKDAYGVQYGAKAGGVAAAATSPVAATDSSGRLNCARILNRSPGRAAAYSFGSSIVAGAIGASIQAGVYQNNLNRCLAQAATAPPVDTNAAIYVGCSRRGGVMRQGTSLCVAP